MRITETENILTVSLTINACTLCCIGCGRLVDFVSTRYKERFKCVSHLADLHARKPWLFGKILTEQMLLLILCVLSVTALGTSSTAELPFVGTDSQNSEIIPRLLLCINIGRYVFMSLQDLYLLHHLQNFKTDLIHHVVTVAACSVFLAYYQNIFLSIATPLIELNLVFLTSGRIMREIPEYRDSKMHRNTTILSCAATLVCRGVLPLIFLLIAVKHDSPFNMMVVPLTLFFLCIVFFFVINFWMIFQTFSRVVKIWSGQKNSRSTSTPGTVLSNPTEPQLYDVTVDGDGVTKPFPLSSVNYGFVKCYDNRNLCNNDNEKMNFGMKKLTKHNIVTDFKDMVPYAKVPNSPSRINHTVNDVFHSQEIACTNNDDITQVDIQTNAEQNGAVSSYVFTTLNESIRSTSSDISGQSTSSESNFIESKLNDEHSFNISNHDTKLEVTSYNDLDRS